MKLSIGVLAHNEEAAIGATISSLLAQSVLADSSIDKEIIVVANGCSDETARVAREALGAHPTAGPSYKVVELERAGKANAWNVFVHEASARDADYLVLLDADIEFAAPDGVAKLVAHLEDNPEILIATDQPVKQFNGGGVFGRLIRALQKTASDGEHAISGQLYAARAAALRSVLMPIGVVVEDGFLRAMTLTAAFSEKETLGRIRRAPGVEHYYRPYQSLSDIWRYERRQAAGTTINRYLYEEFVRWRGEGLDIVGQIARRNADEADWLETLIAERVGKSGPIVVPMPYALRRLNRRQNWTLKNSLKGPLIAATVVFDLAVAVAASRQLRRRAANGRWDSIRAQAG